MVLGILVFSILEVFQQGDSIEIRGLGICKVRDHKARVGRNPHTGKTVAIPDRRMPVFVRLRLFCSRVDQRNSKVRRR